MQKSCSADKSTMYVDNIRQSSERMREMLNTLLDFFRLDNGKEQPNLSPCRISASEFHTDLLQQSGIESPFKDGVIRKIVENLKEIA